MSKDESDDRVLDRELKREAFEDKRFMNKYRMELQREMQLIKNDARFWIAATIIIGMMAILLTTVFQGQYAQTQQLAAIFSGWVSSIVAFYFYGQSNAQAQTQIKNSAKSQTHAEEKANSYQRKLNRIKDLISISKEAPSMREESESAKVFRDKIIKIIDDTI